MAACALAARPSDETLVHLVSGNLKDFGARELRMLGVELSHPDQFLSELFCRSSARFAEAFAAFRSQLRSRESVGEVLRRLAADGQVLTAVLLASAADAGDAQL